MNILSRILNGVTGAPVAGKPPKTATLSHGPRPASSAPPAPPTAPDGSLLSDATIQTIAAKNRVPEPRRAAPTHYHVPPAMIQRLVAGRSLVSESDEAELRELQAKADRVTDFLNQCIANPPKKEYIAQQEALRQAVKSGEDISGRASMTLADFEDAHWTRRRAFKNELRQLSAACHPIAEKVALAIGELAAKAARELADAEEATARTWGTAFTPSHALRVLRHLAEHPLEIVPPAGSQAPRNSLAFAGISTK